MENSFFPPAQPETSTPLLLVEQNNRFLIDWLTVTFKNDTVQGVILKLGLQDLSWSDQLSFVNGYPKDTCFGHIHIRWGCDDPQFYKDDLKSSAEEKAAKQKEKGISLDMSGQGCREFEQYSGLTWLDLLYNIFSSEGAVNFTRLDLAYDDHNGYLSMSQLERDTRERNYLSKSKGAHIHWSDDQCVDLQGLTIEIGSRQSDVLIRIYDKAAERGFRDRHWIRVEIQLRHDRAHHAAQKIFQRDRVGLIASGILNNYLSYRDPTTDQNKSRWPVASYWQKVVLDMEKIPLTSPGEAYNFRKSNEHFITQWGQHLLSYFRMFGEVNSLIEACRQRYPELADKYERAISEFKQRRPFTDLTDVSEEELAEIFGGNALE